jgi:hypothetical protein
VSSAGRQELIVSVQKTPRGRAGKLGTKSEGFCFARRLHLSSYAALAQDKAMMRHISTAVLCISAVYAEKTTGVPGASVA